MWLFPHTELGESTFVKKVCKTTNLQLQLMLLQNGWTFRSLNWSFLLTDYAELGRLEIDTPLFLSKTWIFFKTETIYNDSWIFDWGTLRVQPPCAISICFWFSLILFQMVEPNVYFAERNWYPIIKRCQYSENNFEQAMLVKLKIDHIQRLKKYHLN